MSDAFEAAMSRMARAMERRSGCHLTAEMVTAVTRKGPNSENPATFRQILRELMEASLRVQDFWVVNYITARLGDEDYEAMKPKPRLGADGRS